MKSALAEGRASGPGLITGLNWLFGVCRIFLFLCGPVIGFRLPLTRGVTLGDSSIPSEALPRDGG